MQTSHTLPLSATGDICVMQRAQCCWQVRQAGLQRRHFSDFNFSSRITWSYKTVLHLRNYKLFSKQAIRRAETSLAVRLVFFCNNKQPFLTQRNLILWSAFTFIFYLFAFTEILPIDLWSVRAAQGVTELISCVGDHMTQILLCWHRENASFLTLIKATAISHFSYFLNCLNIIWLLLVIFLSVNRRAVMYSEWVISSHM